MSDQVGNPEDRFSQNEAHIAPAETLLNVSARRCQDGEYRCSNTRCITKSAENTDCDGIDWCTDNSGCRVNWGLVAGLIGGIGSALLGLTFGLCLRCYIKRKTNQVVFLNINLDVMRVQGYVNCNMIVFACLG